MAKVEEDYIVTYLNNKSKVLSFYVDEMLKQKPDQTDLIHYIERIVEIVDEVYSSIYSISIDEMPINDFFNNLFLLRRFNIYEVDKLLSTYNYEKKLKSNYSNLVGLIKQNQELNDEELKQMSFLIKRGLLLKKDKVYLYNYFLRQALIREKNIDYDAFEMLIKRYAIMSMSYFLEHPKCHIIPSEDMNSYAGYAFKEKIFLSKDDVLSLYETGFYKALLVLFHELYHTYQFKLTCIDKKNTSTIRNQIKEEIISKYCPKYYEENHDDVSYEVEANIYSYTSIINLFNMYNLGFGTSQNPYDKIIEELKEKKYNYRRLIDGEERYIDDIFEEIIYDKPEVFEMFPQLSEEYEIIDNHVVRKGNLKLD